MVGQEIAVREEQHLAENIQQLEDNFAMAIRQRELLEEYIGTRLKAGKHFYKVSDDQKPSLTKEGAEVICLPHALKPAYEVLFGPDQPPQDNTPYQMTVRCRLMKGEHFEGEGIGSASSYITKRDGTRQVRQKDIGLCHNATLKMAQKSAYIAATLNATAASEFFTQDVDGTPGSEVQPSQRDQAEGGKLWCAKHKTNWFKRGNMRGYAHPIEGTDKDWCNMPEDAPGTPSESPQTTQEPFSEASQSSEVVNEAPKTDRDVVLQLLEELSLEVQKDFNAWAIEKNLPGLLDTSMKDWKPEQWEVARKNLEETLEERKA